MSISRKARAVGALVGVVLCTSAADVAQAQAAPARDTALTLGDAIHLALRLNPSLEAARLGVVQANSRIAQSRAAFLPSISGTAGNRQRTFNTAELGIAFPGAPGQPPLFDPNGEVLGPVNVYDARLRLSQQLFSPAVSGQLQVARATARATEAEAERQGAEVAAEAAQAYLRLARARAHITDRVADSTLAFELLVIAREQLGAGIGINLDVTRAESQLANSRAQMIAARAEQGRAELNLSRVLGLPLEMRVTPDDPLVPDGATGEALPGESDVVDRALERRAELRALDARIASVERQAGAIRAERLPSLLAFADDGYIGRGVSQLRNTYSWGLQLSVPLLDRRRDSRIDEQATAIRALRADRRALERAITAEARSALLDLASVTEQVGAANERLRLALQEVEQARDRFRAGVAGNAEVITASLSLNAARSAHVDALAAFQAARIALARVQGTITELR